MSEVSIAKPLSGSESIDALFAALRAVLVKDDRFSNHMAYPGFRATLDLKFYPHQSYIPDIIRTVEVVETPTGIEKDPPIEAHVDIPLRPPNQVREEAGLMQPVLVTDAKGHTEEKWVKRVKQPPSPKVPKNRVLGV